MEQSYHKSQYCLVIEPFVYMQIKANIALFYNTLDSVLIELNMTQEIKALFCNDANKYVYNITKQSLLSNISFNDFIEKLEANNIGFLLKCIKAPVQILPFLNIISERLKAIDNDPLNDLSLFHITELSIYLNSELRSNSNNTRKTYKQVLCCYNSEINLPELEFEKIISLIRPALENGTLQRINLLGGDVTEYSKINELINTILEYGKQVNIFIELTSNFKKLMKILFNLKTYEKLSIICTIRKEFISNDLFDKLRKVYFLIPTKIQCIIENSEDFKIFENKFPEVDAKSIIYKPFYNGKNIDFFEKEVFLDKEDIFQIKHDQFDIYRKLKVNQNEFGKLIVLNDGYIYTNINCEPVGHILNNTIQEVIHNLISSNEYSWYNTRKKDKVCSTCLYYAFCPSISNYEYILNKRNLCHIKLD